MALYGRPKPRNRPEAGGKPGAIYMAKKYIKNPMGCIHCHDPHAAKPRVVRDALIQAVLDRGEGTYPYDKAKSKKVTMTKVEFLTGREALPGHRAPQQTRFQPSLRPVPRGIQLQPGYRSEDRRRHRQWRTGGRTTSPGSTSSTSRRPMRRSGFKDFRHGVTGAPLTKLQHPETETFWGSKHERAGLECKDCHMPKVKDKKGKTVTFHGQRSARYMLKDTCVRCHTYWSQEEAEYQVDAVQNYIRGKMRKAEYWLGQMIDTYTRAKDLGVRTRSFRRSGPSTTGPTSSGNGGRPRTATGSTTPSRQGNL